MENTDFEKLKMDYAHTLQQFAMLADIRFKLLAFVPVLAGAAIAFLVQTATPETALAVGLHHEHWHRLQRHSQHSVFRRGGAQD